MLAFVFLWSQVCWQTNGTGQLVAQGLETASQVQRIIVASAGEKKRVLPTAFFPT